MEARFELALAEINHCNKCGFCLPACPTYKLTGNEVDSPRGRIALVEGVLNGEIAADQGLEESLSYCLGCRACETACPSGVQYHRVLEAGKQVLDKTRPSHRALTFLPRALLRLTRHPKRLASLARLGRRTAHWPLPEQLRALSPMLRYRSEEVPGVSAHPEPIGKALFFQGCVQEALFSDANQAAQALLQAAGYTVTEPAGQTCCGAILWHAGRSDEAKALARANIEAFEATGEVPIANTAGGCGAMLSEYGEIFEDDPAWAERAQRFSARVQDWSRLIMESPVQLEFQGNGERVTMQNSCHLVNVEGGGDVPALLACRVAGDQFLPMASQDRCCGSAGIYNIQHPKWANRLLDAKMDEVAAFAPSRVLVVNPGCHMQMTLGVHRSGADAEVEHLARYLYRAFLRAQGQP